MREKKVLGKSLAELVKENQCEKIKGFDLNKNSFLYDRELIIKINKEEERNLTGKI